MKFKVGDTVVVKTTDNPSIKKYSELTGQVHHINPNAELPFQVKFDSIMDSNWFEEDELDIPVKAKPYQVTIYNANVVIRRSKERGEIYSRRRLTKASLARLAFILQSQSEQLVIGEYSVCFSRGWVDA